MSHHDRTLDRAIDHVVAFGSTRRLGKSLGLRHGELKRIIGELRWLGIVDSRRALLTADEWRAIRHD